MRLNKLFSTTFLLGLAELAHCLSGGHGEMTFYGTNGNRPSDEHHPACGKDSKYQTDFYVAINHGDFDKTKTNSSSYSATVCDQCIMVMRNGKYAIGRVVDRCAGKKCVSGNVDVSPEMFEKLDSLGAGRVDVTWKLLDSCSRLEEYGTCSGSDCSASSSSEKTTTRKVTTKKTTSVKTSVVAPKTLATKSTPSNPNVSLPTSFPVIKTNLTNPIQNSNNMTIPNLPTTAKTVPINQSQNQNQNGQNEKAKEEVKEEEKSEGGSSAKYIAGGISILTVSGAAGIGLLYAKRNSTSYKEMKQKFPEAFNNIKRSITRGSSNIRRGLTRSGTALKRTISGKRAQGKTNFNRDSLIANYPVNNYEPSESLPQPTIKIYEN